MNKALNEPKIPKAIAHNIEASGPILMHPSPKRVNLNYKILISDRWHRSINSRIFTYK